MEGDQNVENVKKDMLNNGIQTNIEEQKQILKSKQFVGGNFGTSLYSELFPST